MPGNPNGDTSEGNVATPTAHSPITSRRGSNAGAASDAPTSPNTATPNSSGGPRFKNRMSNGKGNYANGEAHPPQYHEATGPAMPPPPAYGAAVYGGDFPTPPPPSYHETMSGAPPMGSPTHSHPTSPRRQGPPGATPPQPMSRSYLAGAPITPTRAAPPQMPAAPPPPYGMTTSPMAPHAAAGAVQSPTALAPDQRYRHDPYSPQSPVVPTADGFPTKEPKEGGKS